MNITTGKKKEPLKCVFYAPEGFGKSTFASKWPDPLYIDTEGSTSQLDVRRFGDDMTKWDNILGAVDYVIANPTICKTLVIDTIDWAERAIISKLNKEYCTANVLTMDYGNGSLLVVTEFEKLIYKLDAVLAKGINVLLLAHASIRKQELPEEMGAFDHWELKLQSKQVKALVKEWPRMLLFGNYKTYVVEDGKTKSKKSQGGKRVLYTQHHSCWDAKNSYDLPEVMDFDFKKIAYLFSSESAEKTTLSAENREKTAKTDVKPEKKEIKEEPKPEVPWEYETEEPEVNSIEKKLREFMALAHFTEDEIIVTFHEKKKFENANKLSEISDWEFIEKSVLGNWASFSKAVQKYGVETPFIEHWGDEKEGGKKDGGNQ